MKTLFLIFSLLILVCGPGPLAEKSLAAPPASGRSPADTPRDGPISITADHMTANDNSKVVTFTGRVIARQDDLIITCEEMKVYYQPRTAAAAPAAPTAAAAPSPETADPLVTAAPNAAPNAEPETDSEKAPAFSGSQEIDRVECQGAVRIQQGDRLAVGQKALYLANSRPRRLILTGDARVWQGRNAVTGHEVTYFLDENRSQVESQNNSRVRAFYEKDQDPKKNK
jgi:lipopolysaccharide export system protein LptA